MKVQLITFFVMTFGLFWAISYLGNQTNVLFFIIMGVWQLQFISEIGSSIFNKFHWLRAITPSFLMADFGEELGRRGFINPPWQSHFSVILSSLIMVFMPLL